MFRLAGILQGIVGRVRDGTASNEHAALMEDRVKPLFRCRLVLRPKGRRGRLSASLSPREFQENKLGTP